MTISARSQRLIDRVWPIALLVLAPVIIAELLNLRRKSKAEV